MSKRIYYPLILFSFIFTLFFFTDGKTQVYSGDPAYKRGFELGYDAGTKSGKGDKKENKKQNPTAQENYKLADKKFRYEYGSRAKFVSGYQGGFLKGYKVGFGDLKGLKIKEEQKVSSPAPASTSKPKTKKNHVSEDAL